MSKQRINTLYSMLINIDDRNVFEDYYSDIINDGKVKVNEKRIKTDNINMSIYLNDIIQYKDQKYKVGINKLEIIV